MRRTCKKCGEKKPVDQFPTAGTKNGIKYYRHQCKPCYQARKLHRRYHNRKWLAEYKSKLECEKCGYSKDTHDSFRTQALEFHHHNGDKLRAVSDMANSGFSVEKIMNEINKCQVLCSRCHIESHYT